MINVPKDAFGEMTMVKIDRKKMVAFGLRTLVKKPIFMAENGEISSSVLL